MQQLRILSGDLAGNVFALVPTAITIGRESNNLVCIEEDEVSRYHAVLIPDNGSCMIRDLDSTNGTFVNGQPIRERRLLSGDVIRVGPLEIRYESDSPSPVPSYIRITRPLEPPLNHSSAPPVVRPFPIPPRIALRAASYAPSEKVYDAAPRFQISYSTGADEFVHEAKSLVNRRETHALFVPFMSYWPTYHSMTSAQQKWYFYWRDQVRNGAYPDTDLSYVFVHVYELINNVGVRDGAHGYQQLHTLWLNYRDRYRKLDHYLIDWLADYTVLNDCLVDPLAVYHEAFELNIFVRDPDILLAKVLNGSTVPLTLPLITLLANYRIQHSKFYINGNRASVEETIPKVLDRVNSHMKEKDGAGIFEKFRPGSPSVVQRHPFQSGVYAGRRNLTTIATVFRYSHCAGLRTFLTAVIKHSENCLRELRGYRGRLRGYGLPPEIKPIIEEFVRALSIPPPVRQKVVVDLTRVEELTRDSDRVREMLLAGKDAPRPCEDKREGGLPETIAGTIVPKRPKGIPANLLTHLDPVCKILVGIVTEEARILEFLMRQHWEADDTLLAKEFPDVILEQAVDHINELALNCLGDMLVMSENTKLVVAEDYRDELEFLIADGFGVKAAEERGKRVGGPPKGWDEFSVQLQDYQLQVLTAITVKDAALDKLRQIAAARATMPEVLIDSINELAQNTVGDIIIDTNVFPPVVEEEDLEMVRKVLSSATGDTHNGAH